MGLGSAPKYTPPPTPPPAAAPPTLATSSVQAAGANQLNASGGAALQDFGASGTQGVPMGDVKTGRITLGGVS